jgi:hypothetical protein
VCDCVCWFDWFGLFDCLFGCCLLACLFVLLVCLLVLFVLLHGMVFHCCLQLASKYNGGGAVRVFAMVR